MTIVVMQGKESFTEIQSIFFYLLKVLKWKTLNICRKSVKDRNSIKCYLSQIKVLPKLC